MIIDLWISEKVGAMVAMVICKGFLKADTGHDTILSSGAFYNSFSFIFTLVFYL